MFLEDNALEGSAQKRIVLGIEFVQDCQNLYLHKVKVNAQDSSINKLSNLGLTDMLLIGLLRVCLAGSLNYH